MNAASFIADGLMAMNRAAAHEPAPASPIEAMQRAEVRFRRIAAEALPDSLEEQEFLAWAADLRAAINQARGL